MSTIKRGKFKRKRSSRDRTFEEVYASIQIPVPEGFAKDGDFGFVMIGGKRFRVTVHLVITKEEA